MKKTERYKRIKIKYDALTSVTKFIIAVMTIISTLLGLVLTVLSFFN